MPRYDEAFLAGFNPSFKSAQDMAFERWKYEQENKPENMLKKNLGLLMMVNPELGAQLMGQMGGGVPTNQPPNMPMGQPNIGMGAPIRPPQLTGFPPTQYDWKSSMLGQTPESKMMQDLYGEQKKSEIKGEAKAKEARLKADSNFGRVATSVKQMWNYYKGAVEEGGAGNIAKTIWGKFATGTLGGELGEKMVSTGKLVGQNVELTLALMPILTNQNRFLSTVMEAIAKSVPQGQEGLKLAQGKLEQTLLNQYSITRGKKNGDRP